MIKTTFKEKQSLKQAKKEHKALKGSDQFEYQRQTFLKAIFDSLNKANYNMNLRLVPLRKSERA